MRVFERFFDFRHGSHSSGRATGENRLDDSVVFDHLFRDFDEHIRLVNPFFASPPFLPIRG